VGKLEGKTPLGRARRRWEDGIRMDLREIGWGVLIGFDRWRAVVNGDELFGFYATDLVSQWLNKT
jgi:hypothetical protein